MHHLNSTLLNNTCYPLSYTYITHPDRLLTCLFSQFHHLHLHPRHHPGYWGAGWNESGGRTIIIIILFIFSTSALLIWRPAATLLIRVSEHLLRKNTYWSNLVKAAPSPQASPIKENHFSSWPSFLIYAKPGVPYYLCKALISRRVDIGGKASLKSTSYPFLKAHHKKHHGLVLSGRNICQALVHVGYWAWGKTDFWSSKYKGSWESRHKATFMFWCCTGLQSK